MADVLNDSTMISCEKDNRVKILLKWTISILDIGVSLEPSLESYERMEFTSIEDAKNYYTRYTKLKGFSFRMGCIIKSRINGMIIVQDIVCSK